MPTSFPLPNADLRLDGHGALVTGASAGLGRHFARVLASAGAKVAVAARRRDRLDSLVDEIEADGGAAVAVPLDVTVAGQIPAAVDAAEAALGPVTMLVNNAGIPDARYATEMPLELIDAVLSTNLRGPFLLATEVARRMIDRGLPGRIVNISSSGAFYYGGTGSALYSVTKTAINRMTEVLAVEWAKFHINVNAIAPGVFQSEMVERMKDRMGDVAAAVPRKRIGDPAQLDSTLLYLLAPASECVTGTVIRVDDGQRPR